jgi:hypothetical protein
MLNNMLSEPVQEEGVRRASVVMRGPLEWYDDKTENPPWIKALAEVRRLAPRRLALSPRSSNHRGY